MATGGVLDRFYLEMQGHDSDGQHDLNRRIVRLTEETGAPLVVTSDAHLLCAGSHQAHDVLLCIALAKDFGRAQPHEVRRAALTFVSSNNRAKAVPKKGPASPEIRRAPPRFLPHGRLGPP